MNQLYGAISDEIGSTKPWEFAVLRAFLARDEWTGSQLARLYPTNPSRVGRLVNNLVQGGLLYKIRSPIDQRVVHLRLTEEGERVLTELQGRATALKKKLTEGITPEEQEVFQSTILKIKANYARMKRTELQVSPALPSSSLPFL